MSTSDSDSPCSSAVMVVSSKEVVWQRRDIAFLKTQEELESECQEVILGQDVNYGATGHPCIIMDMAPNGKHALITTVSSFRSGPHDKYRPPWQRNYHQGKDPDRFRAFVGTERPNLYRQSLCLEGGRQFPKSRTAWVYAGWVHLVPVGALRPFFDVKLRIEMQSWIDLYRHQNTLARINSDIFNDPRLHPNTFTYLSSVRTDGSTDETRQSSSPRPAIASLISPTRLPVLSLANGNEYENVAGNLTHQLAALYQHQLSPSNWAQHPQQTRQICGQYQYHQQQYAGPSSYMAGTGLCMYQKPYRGY